MAAALSSSLRQASVLKSELTNVTSEVPSEQRARKLARPHRRCTAEIMLASAAIADAIRAPAARHCNRQCVGTTVVCPTNGAQPIGMSGFRSAALATRVLRIAEPPQPGGARSPYPAPWCRAGPNPPALPASASVSARDRNLDRAFRALDGQFLDWASGRKRRCRYRLVAREQPGDDPADAAEADDGNAFSFGVGVRWQGQSHFIRYLDRSS